MNEPEFQARTKLERVLYALFATAAALIIPGITLLIAADTTLRYVFLKPLTWGQDVAGLGLFVMYCACLPISLHGGFHVRMSLVYDRMPVLFRQVVDTISIAATLAFGAVLAWYAMLYVPTAFRREVTMLSSPIPVWPFALAGAVGCALFCVASLFWARNVWRKSRTS